MTNVVSSNALNTNAIVIGTNGTQNVQSSPVLIDTSGNITNCNSLQTTGYVVSNGNIGCYGGEMFAPKFILNAYTSLLNGASTSVNITTPPSSGTLALLSDLKKDVFKFRIKSNF